MIPVAVLLGASAVVVARRSSSRACAHRRAMALVAVRAEPDRGLAAVPASARRAVAAVVLVAAVWASLGWGAVVVATVAAAGLVAWRSLQRREARARAVASELPEALEDLARSLRAGVPLAEALDAAAARADAVAEDLALLASELRHGVRLHDALHEWTLRGGDPGVRLAATALALGTELGGSRAAALDRVAATLRARLALRRELEVQSTQARLSAAVIALAPLGFAALGLLGDRDLAAFFLATPAGLVCLAVGMLLDAIGSLWMLRIVAAASP